MKLSKQILTMIVATSTVAIVSTSCEKENVRPENNEFPECGFGEEGGEKYPDVYCEACGMG